MRSTNLGHQSESGAGRSAVSDDAQAVSAGPEAPVGSWVGPVPGLVQGSGIGQVRRRGDEPKDPLGGSRVGPEIDGALARLQGRGRPLPEPIARSMGEAMGADLGQVRIHTGSEPAGLARSVQATAFTLGQDIFFGADSYAPQTPSGQRLLAHELAHTVQPGTGGGSGVGPVIGRAADPAEAEADRVADSVLEVLRRRASEPDEPGNLEHRADGGTASPAVLRKCSAGRTATGPAEDTTPRSANALGGSRRQLFRKVGFEAELMVPSLGPSANTLTYPKDPGGVAQSVKSFLDGGVPYDTDIGGKAGGADVRLDSDHGGSIDRTPIVNEFIKLGLVSGVPSEPRSKIEFVTAAVDELAPGANKRLATVAKSLKKQLTDTLELAKSGQLKQLGPPAKPGYKTGVPVEDLAEFYFWEKDEESLAVKTAIEDYLKNGIQDDVYLQATVGIIPSALLKFFAQAARPGGRVELAPPSAARKQLLGIVDEYVKYLKTSLAKAPEEHWFKKLDPVSEDAFLGLLGLVFSYLLGDTLHQTSAGTHSVVKNAVPFLIKMSPYGLLAKTAPHMLQDNPPPKDFVRQLGGVMKKSKYLQVAYWVEEARKDAPTAVSEDRLPEKLDARPRVDRLVTGDYTDFVEQVLLDSGGVVEVIVGKELPKPDEPPTNSGDIDVFHELYNQSGIPLEYRAITKRYKISEVLPALREIITEVREANMNGLTEEQKAKVKEAYESDV